jgi:hypothetical protein
MINKIFLKIKSCVIYVCVYNLKSYNENFEINILNWCYIYIWKFENYNFYRSMQLEVWIKLIFKCNF